MNLIVEYALEDLAFVPANVVSKFERKIENSGMATDRAGGKGICPVITDLRNRCDELETV